MTKYNYKVWANELAYLQSVNPKKPGKTYNYDPECFARYCNMQANGALRDGFRQIATEIAQWRDIADPDFRSKAHHWPDYIIRGPFAFDQKRFPVACMPAGSKGNNNGHGR